MGLLDKAKEAAKTVGDKAQEGIKAGQEKVDEVKTKKRISDLKEELGGIVFEQRAGYGAGERRRRHRPHRESDLGSAGQPRGVMRAAHCTTYGGIDAVTVEEIPEPDARARSGAVSRCARPRSTSPTS